MVVGPLLYLYLIFTGYTSRLNIIGRENDDHFRNNRCIIAFWHCHLFYILFHYRKVGNLYAMVSPSADGEIVTGISHLFGYIPVRGSTHENPRSSLLTMARKIRAGGSSAIVADGSRGPARRSQMGSVYLAKMTSAPIVPLAFDADRKIRLGNWDKTIIPLPFSNISVAVGKPISVGPDAGQKELGEKNRELEDQLNRLTEQAEQASVK